MSLISTAASALQSALRQGTHLAQLAPFVRVLSSNPCVSFPGSVNCPYSSSSSGGNSGSNGSRSGAGAGSASSRNKEQAQRSSQQHKQQQHTKHHQRHNAAAAAAAAAANGPTPWPQPSRLVLPNRKATAPVLGRVPPSSKAAAAATAQVLKAANPPIQPKAPAALTASDADHDILEDTATADKFVGSSSTSSSSSSSSNSGAVQEQNRHPKEAAAAAVLEAAAVHAYPWEVVATLPAHSPYPLEAMAEMDVAMYISYMRDSRLGMPSVFELGIVREQGFKGRMQLLRREQLLHNVIKQLQQAVNNMTGSNVDCGGAVQNQPYGSSSSSSVPDELLQELTQEQLEAAAAAASAAHVACAGATPEEVADCVLDYFVFKRCAQLMLLQRQHRQLMQQQHEAFLQQQQQQQQQEQGGSTAELQAPFTAEELAAVDIWDAFFDATLLDYLHYLDLAAAGAPSVFTTINPNAPETQRQQHQQQQQQQDDAVCSAADANEEQHYAACQLLLQTTKILGLLPNGMIQRPGLLIGKQQILSLAARSGSSVVDVAEVLQDFYKLKRFGFRAALEQLTEVADEHSALARF